MTVAEFTIDQPPKTSRRSPLRWVISHVLHNRFLVAVMVIGAFGNAALASVIPLLVGRSFTAAEAGQLQLISWFAIIIVLSQVVRAISQFGRNFGAQILGERVERDVRRELYLNLLGKSMTFHALQPVGDTMARATNDVRELNLLISSGINLAVGSAYFMFMPLILAPSYHWQLVLAPLLFNILYIVALTLYLRELRPITDLVRASFGKLNSRLSEAVDGIETIKGSAQEEQEIGRFSQLSQTYRNNAIAQSLVEARFLPLLLLGLTTALAFAHACYLYLHDQLVIGQVIGYSSLMTLFGFPTFVSLLAYSQIARGMAGARRIFALLQMTTELDQNPNGHDARIEGNISFENVTAGYTSQDVLHNISFKIEAGQTVAIVGQTGAGKSTLAKLINRTYDVRSGVIKIDGVDLRHWNLAVLRRQISIIEQDIFLFSRTIAENIAFGDPTATREMIIEAAQSAQAHEFITSFPNGYETVVGERGVTLSGGQRQRIALARAFLTHPQILILDDSTSAIDSATEDKIQLAITEAATKQTTILITHRLSQIRWADKVVLLRQGRVVAVGDHDSLMRDYAAYRRIFEQYEQ